MLLRQKKTIPARKTTPSSSRRRDAPSQSCRNSCSRRCVKGSPINPTVTKTEGKSRLRFGAPPPPGLRVAVNLPLCPGLRGSAGAPSFIGKATEGYLKLSKPHVFCAENAVAFYTRRPRISAFCEDNSGLGHFILH